MSLWCKQIAFASPRIFFSKRSATAAIRTPSSAALSTLSPVQKEQISLYITTLLQWNQRMNLTAVTEEGEVMKRHVEDSLALIPPINTSYSSHCLPRQRGGGGGGAADVAVNLNLVDVGSGAGLPGLIFAIACPSWKVTLLESMQKRCLFLDHVVDLIGLSNVEILRERAEMSSKDDKMLPCLKSLSASN